MFASKIPTAWVPLLCTSAWSVVADAGVIDDSKATLVLRNYYFDRDYSDAGAPQSQRQEWAQGFIFKATSGYSPGFIGVGLDVLGLVGVKLDSSPDRTGTELLPYDHDDGRAPGSYGRLGLTAKVRLSHTELRLGELMPDLPILRFNDGRLLPQTFQGAMLTSKEIDHLTLHAGRIHAFSPRSAADSEDLYPSISGRTIATATSDRFTYAGGEYSLGQASAVGVWTAELENVYRQNYYSITHYQPIGGWAVCWGPSIPATRGARWQENWITGRLPCCSRPLTAATGFTWVCSACMGRMAGSPSIVRWAVPWPTTCSPTPLCMPTSGPGNCATTTTLQPWAYQG